MSFAATCATSLDWAGILQRYEWHGDWRAGLTTRRELATRLSQAWNREKTVEAIDAITRWGRVPLLRGGALDGAIATLDRLDSLAVARGEYSGIFATRIASVSKVYEMHDMARWVIYDSRVAWALEALRAEVGAAHPSISLPPAFPQPPGRSRAPYPGAAAVRTEAQGRSGFVQASITAREIAQHITQPCPDPVGWQAVHVEMALFTIGGGTLPKEAMMAGAAAKSMNVAKAGPVLAKAVANSSVVRGTIEEQVLLVIESQFAKARAMRYARQTDSLAANVQFADGPQRWVVFNDGAPIASFPGYDGDLDDALRFHNYERLKMRTPVELEAELDAERDKRRKRWKLFAKDLGGEQKAVIEEILQLEAGEALDVADD